MQENTERTLRCSSIILRHPHPGVYQCLLSLSLLRKTLSAVSLSHGSLSRLSLSLALSLSSHSGNSEFADRNLPVIHYLPVRVNRAWKRSAYT